MKTLIYGHENVSKLIFRKNLPPDAAYRLSRHVYLYAEAGRYLVKSTLTGEVIELTGGEWTALEAL